MRLLIAAFLLIASAAVSADVLIKGGIEAPTAYLDGRPLAIEDLDHYELRIEVDGTQVGVESVPIQGAQTPLERQFAVTGGQQVCITAKAIHVDGSPSPSSNELCKEAPGQPAAPTIVEFELLLVAPQE